MKKQNSALWNGHWGAKMTGIVNSAPDNVLSFVRQNERDKVFAVINFSDQPQTVTFKDGLHHGKYVEYFSGKPADLDASTKLSLAPWTYQVFVR